MKRVTIALALLAGLYSFSFTQQPAEPVKAEAGIAFEKMEHDFGNIAFGSDGTYIFSFTNKTKEPIVLTNVTASCGCTSPMWTREPIKPGEKGEVKVKYNTNAPGMFNKTVMVYSSAQPSPVILRIKGNVLPKESSEASQN